MTQINGIPPSGSPKEVILIGATGLVGSFVLQKLLPHPLVKRVTTISRRWPSTNNHLHVKLLEQKWNPITANFEHIEKFAPKIKGDVLISAFGTTIAKAKSYETFRHWELELPIHTAQIALENGCKHFLLVSAVGSTPKSKVSYVQIKGELDRQASTLGFERVDLFRPSMLLGERAEFRAAEKAGALIFPAISKLLPGPLRRFRAIEAQTVAEAMVYTALSGHPEKGHHDALMKEAHIHYYDEMIRSAALYQKSIFSESPA